MMSPTAKARRHPPARSCSRVRSDVNSAPTAALNRFCAHLSGHLPGAVDPFGVGGRDLHQERRRDPNSPPTEKPCNNREVRTTTGANRPAVRYVGAKVIRAIDTPMRVITRVSAAFLPFLSP